MFQLAPSDVSSRLDNWEGGGGVFLYSCSEEFLFKSIVLVVCEDEYKNICSSPP